MSDDKIEATQQSTDGAQVQPKEDIAPPAAQDGQTALFQKWHEANVKPEMEKRDAEIHNLRTAQGRLEAQLKKAREWGDEDIASFTKAYGTYEGAKVNWSKRGVPDWLLDSAHPSKLDEAAEKYLAERGAPAPNGSAEYQRFVEWQKAQANGGATALLKNDPIMAGGGSQSSQTQVTKDNIDKLYLDGAVSDEKYRTFLRTGGV